MTKKRPKLPIEAFDRRFLPLLLEGTRREIRLTQATPGRATRVRMELNMFREKLREAGHPQANHLYRAETVIEKEDPCTLIIRPRGSSILGLDNFTESTEPLVPEPQVPGFTELPTEQDLDNLLDKLWPDKQS